MSYHETPPHKRSQMRGKCSESCRDLRFTVGDSSLNEIDQYLEQLINQRDSTRSEPFEWVKKESDEDLKNADELRRLEEIMNINNEIACINKWLYKCEVELSECDENCNTLKDYYQSGTDNPISADAAGVLTLKELEVVENDTIKRSEVVEAKRNLKCIKKYEEECLNRESAIGNVDTVSKGANIGRQDITWEE